MKIYRIINKQTGMFLRDDFTFNEETEIGLEVNPAQGFYHPKWDGEQWGEGLTPQEIQARKPKPDYATLVSEMIAEKYSLNQELALHRQRETKVQEFQEYFDYCEECKQIARGIIDKSH